MTEKKNDALDIQDMDIQEQDVDDSSPIPITTTSDVSSASGPFVSSMDTESLPGSSNPKPKLALSKYKL